MDAKHIKTGQIGEDTACGYLKRIGYKLVDRNYSQKYGEIDIIAINTSKILTFIEVKTILVNSILPVDNSAGVGISPENNLTHSKFTKLSKICQFYANKNPNLVGDKGWQIDLIAILLDDRGESRISHYENISA